MQTSRHLSIPLSRFHCIKVVMTSTLPVIQMTSSRAVPGARAAPPRCTLCTDGARRGEETFETRPINNRRAQARWVLIPPPVTVLVLRLGQITFSCLYWSSTCQSQRSSSHPSPFAEGLVWTKGVFSGCCHKVTLALVIQHA